MKDGDTKYKVKRTGSDIFTNKGKVKIGDIESKSGIYRYGFLNEKQLDEDGLSHKILTERKQ